jgi:D-3-phosphoglycerate dehydrogenase
MMRAASRPDQKRHGGEPWVLVCGRLSGSGLEILRSAGCRADHQPQRGAGSLADAIRPYQGVIVHTRQVVDAATFEAGRELRVVGRAGAGVDNIDLEAAERAGVQVLSVAGANAISAAEHTIGLMIALARDIPAAAAELEAGIWDRPSHLGIELHGRVLGMVGLGRIGRHVACRAQALGMQVRATDPIVDDATAAELNVEMVALDELLAGADIVTLHLPLDRETHHIIDRRALSLMRRGSRLINCARGGLVDEAALLEALASGHLAGAACDVFENEPDPDPDLLSHPGFVGTPHLGGATLEAHRRVDEEIARQVAAHLAAAATR